MSLKLIDPNSINDGFSAQPEDFCIDLQLTAFRKGKSVLLGEGKNINTNQIHDTNIDLITGTNISGINSLTTLYTEIGSSFDIIGEDNAYMNLESLGITSVDIDFDSSNIPVVKMTLTDVRGRLFQQGNESPFSIFFQFPYPLFKLKAKGIYGKSISYDLHLIKFNTQFNSDFGGFEINCEFVGYSYAYLSDLLIGYTRAVPYTTVGSELMSTYTESFSEYQNKAFKLAEIARNHMINKTAGVIEEQKTEITKYESLMDSFKNSIIDTIKTSAREYESSTDGIFIIAQRDDRDIKEDKQNFITIQELFTTKLNNEFSQSKITFDVTINTSFKLNDNNANHTEGIGITLNNFNKKYTGTREIVTVIDGSKFFENIKNASSTLKNDIDVNTQEQISDFSETLTVNGLNPSIGEYFKMLCGHSDLLWASIHKIAENILGDDSRNSQFSDISQFSDSQESEGKDNGKILPFPDCKKLENGVYVDEWIGNLSSGGSKIPEANFVEELIQGFLKAYKELKELDEKLNSFENDTNKTENNVGTLTYIPIHPMDGPIGGSGTQNPYYGINDYQGFIKRLGNRICGFLALQNIDPINKKTLSKEVLISLCDAEFYNIKSYLNEHKTLGNLLQTKTGQTTEEIEFFGVKMTDGKKTEFMKDVYNYIGSKLYKIKDIPGKINFYEFRPEEDRKNCTINFTPDGVKIPLSLSSGHISNDNLIKDYNIPDQSVGKYIEITVADSIDQHSVISNPEIEAITSLDTENKYKNRTELLINKKFGGSYIDTAGSDTSSVFFSKKNINFEKESAAMVPSFFTGINVPSYINPGTKKFINYKNFTKYDEFIQINLGKNLYSKETKKYSVNIDYRSGLDNPNYYVSDIPIMTKNKIGSLFLDPFYIYQSAEVKAFMFLHALPFGFNGENPGSSQSSLYFTKNLMDLISERTKTIKGNYLWCALIGGILKINKLSSTDPKYRIYIEKNNIKLTNFKYDTPGVITSNKDKYLKNTRSILCEESHKVLKDYGLGIVRNGEGFINFPPSFLTLPVNVKNEFIEVFDKFLDEFKTQILPYSLIFKNGIPNNTYDYTSSEIEINSNNFNSKTLSEYSFFSFTDNYRTTPRSGETIPMLKHHANMAKFSSNSNLTKNITNLSKKIAFISIGHGSLFSPEGLTKKNLLNQIPYNYLYDTFGTITELLNQEITNTITENQNMLTELKEMVGLNDSEDIRIKVYKDIKSIYEKWVNGDTNFKNLYEKFKFQNRHYKDISLEFKINPINMIKDLMSNLHQPLIAHISKVLSENNFNFLPTPSYIDIHNMDEMTDMFRPYRWNEENTATESMFVCMYIGEFSSKLDLDEKDNYRSDGIKLTIDDSATSPEITQISAPDFNTGDYDIPVIRVKFGDQKQSIFKRFGLDQSEFTITNESLVVTDDLTKNNGLSQNLYDIYVSRSYTLNLELLGNFTIQPFMYLYLENIPMFFGLYYIIKVSHKINGNTAYTTIKAVRMRQTMTKMLDEESLYYSLFSIFKDAQLNGNGSNYVSGSGEGAGAYVDTEIKENGNIKIGSGNNELFLLKDVANFFNDLASQWRAWNDSNGKLYGEYLVFNAGSLKGGGAAKSASGGLKHKTHKYGDCVDIRIIKSGYNSWDTTGSTFASDYTQIPSKKLIELALNLAKTPKYSSLVNGESFIEFIMFGDKELKSSEVRYDPKVHYNHYHLKFKIPTYITKAISEKNNGATSIGESSSGTGGMFNTLPESTGKGWAANKNLIIAASKMVGFDEKTMVLICGIESSFNPGDGAKTSSAKGLYQFTNDTWKEVVRDHGEKYGITSSISPFNAKANAVMGACFLKDNLERIKKVKNPVAIIDLYFLHLLGKNGGLNFIKTFLSSPNNPAAPNHKSAAKSNSTIFYDNSRARTYNEIYVLLRDRLITNNKELKVDAKYTG